MLAKDTVRETLETGESKSLPEKLTPPQEAAESLARAESSNFASVATRPPNPRYRQNGTGTPGASYMKNMWRPLLYIALDKLQEMFTRADNGARDSEQWQQLVRKFDQESAANSNGQPSAELKQQLSATARDLLKPILEAVNGNGDDLLTSVLPPAILHFLLELDRQHTKQWEVRSKRLLEQQILYFDIKNLYEEMGSLKEGADKSVLTDKIKEAYRKDVAYKLDRKAEGKAGEAELAALAALTDPKLVMKPEQLENRREQLKKHDEEFRTVRHQSLQAFIGIRGLSNLYAARHSKEQRALVLLTGYLATFLSELSLMNRLLDCSDAEREQVATASESSMESLQAQWRHVLLKNESDKRTARILNRLDPSDKVQRQLSGPPQKAKQRSEKEIAAQVAAWSGHGHPGNAPNVPKRRSQPAMWQRPSDLEVKGKREDMIRRFLKKHGIQKLAQAAPDSEQARILDGLSSHLLGRSKRLDEDLMMKRVLDKLSEDIKSLPEDSEARDVIGALITELMTKAAMESREEKDDQS